MRLLWKQVQALMMVLSRNLKLLFNRRKLLLAEESEFSRLLADIAPNIFQGSQPPQCASCKRMVEPSSVSAFQVGESGEVQLFCDRPGCGPSQEGGG